MNYRKHILTAIFGVMLLLYAGDWLLRNALEGPLGEQRRKNDALRQRIEKREAELARARQEGKLLTEWERQSLPADTEVARSLYQAWLLELIGHVGLGNPTVDSGEPAGRKGIYQALSFAVRGRGTLEDLTKFLFEFYRAGHLHQIRSLVITPLAASSQLDLSIGVEALVLPNADRVDRLNDGNSQRLASQTLADYQVIVDRNLFGVGGSLDPLELTQLTAVTSANGRPVAWFSVRSSDKKLELGEGQDFEIGQFRARVVKIKDSDVVLESDGQRWLLTLGESLADAAALPPED